MRHASNRASEIGHPCLRWHMANRLIGHLAPAPDQGLLGVFARGRYFEEWATRELFPTLADRRVVATQGELYDHQLDLSGHFDFRFRLENGAERITDTKCMVNGASMDSWERIPVRFAPKYRAQLEVYMRLSETPEASLWIGDAVSWTKGHELVVAPDDTLWESIKLRCVRLREEQARLLPLSVEELIGQDGLLTVEGLELGNPQCAGCKWKETIGCAWSLEGLAILETPEMLELLERRDELSPFAAEYQQVDKEIKTILATAHPDGGDVLCGGWTCKGKLVKRAGYTVQPGSYMTWTIGGAK